jgi:predicted  nucleic acid-binding Zn-ribbon protein
MTDHLISEIAVKEAKLQDLKKKLIQNLNNRERMKQQIFRLEDSIFDLRDKLEEERNGLPQTRQVNATD